MIEAGSETTCLWGYGMRGAIELCSTNVEVEFNLVSGHRLIVGVKMSISRIKVYGEYRLSTLIDVRWWLTVDAVYTVCMARKCPATSWEHR